MKPALFEYHAPERLEEALALMGDDERDVRAIAGGQSLVPMMNFRLATPEVLVDLRRIPELATLEVGADGSLTIGAGVRQQDVLDDARVAATWPLLAAAISHIGHPQIRSRGTVCGSLAHHDPHGELPAAATVLDARMTVNGPDGERSIDAADFFVSYYEVALEFGELLTAVTFPAPAPGTGWGFCELTRRHGDFALAGAAATLRRDGDGAADPRIVVFGVGDRPLRMTEAEAALAGAAVDEAALEAVREAVAGAVEPVTDIHASAEYRTELAAHLAAEAVNDAWERTDA
jgi:carbon-monoxide dehydrogenase medium subunit